LTAYAATAAAVPRPQLALVALVVLALHALLLLGLPRWTRTVPVTGGPPMFQIRTIALGPSQPVTASAQAAPEPHPPQPKSKLRPRPKPPLMPLMPHKPPSGTAAPGKGLPLPVLTVADPPPPTASAETADTGSLLQAPPLATFGDQVSPLPIAPPLPPDQVLAAMQQAASSATPGTPDPTPPVQLPRSVDMAYQATATQNGRPVTLSSTIIWRRDEQFYNLHWRLYGPAIGDHSRDAKGLVTARGLAPITAQAMGPNGYALLFDYAQSRLRGPSLPSASAPESAGLALPPGAQDPLSVLIQLSGLIAGNPAQYPVGSRITLPVANSADQPVRQADFVIVDDSDFSFLSGALANQRSPALHLVHEPASDHDTRVELWLAKRLDYLPVRLLLTPATGGNPLDMTLQSATLPPAWSASSAPAADDSGAP
jgi:hypothetical protein